MHGSPLSKWDNRLIWNHIDYREYGFIGEPYLDIDYSKVRYLSDTGRRWDGRSSIRDLTREMKGRTFRRTFEIIEALKKNELRGQVLLNTHPQRWNNNLYFWTKELVLQSIKNPVKRMIR